jgi:phospholipase/lecithinase/hemolysin
VKKAILRCLGAALVCAALASAGSFNQLVVFGDSLSDNGNDYIASSGTYPAPPPAYQNGTFTDGPDTFPVGTGGPLWHEYLAGALGLATATPLPVGGTNYAFGGATAAPYTGEQVPSVAEQVEWYLETNSGANPNTLYAMWGGANDIFDAAEAPGATQASVIAAGDEAAIAMGFGIMALADAGAQDIVWMNLPPLDLTPFGQSIPLGGAMGLAAQEFNADQLIYAGELESMDPNLHIAVVNVYGIFESIVADPSAYGYTNVTSPSQGQAGVNPDTYLFWDDVHPTTTGQMLIGEAAEQAVQTQLPEPASFAFVGAGLLGVWITRRVRAGRA